jgi:hypothetical protein
MMMMVMNGCCKSCISCCFSGKGNKIHCQWSWLTEVTSNRGQGRRENVAQSWPRNHSALPIQEVSIFLQKEMSSFRRIFSKSLERTDCSTSLGYMSLWLHNWIVKSQKKSLTSFLLFFAQSHPILRNFVALQPRLLSKHLRESFSFNLLDFLWPKISCRSLSNPRTDCSLAQKDSKLGLLLCFTSPALNDNPSRLRKIEQNNRALKFSVTTVLHKKAEKTKMQ